MKIKVKGYQVDRDEACTSLGIPEASVPWDSRYQLVEIELNGEENKFEVLRDPLGEVELVPIQTFNVTT